MRRGCACAVLSVLAACGPSLSEGARRLIVTDSPAYVSGCDDLGPTQGTAEAVLEEGAARGATHMLWVAVAGPMVQAEAFDCTRPRRAAAAPAPTATPPAPAAPAAPAAEPKPPDGPRISSGTCFFAADGVAITNHHVVDGAAELAVIDSTGGRHPATVLRSSADSDLAVLDVPAAPAGNALALATATTAALGQPVFTIGFPYPDQLGADPKFSDGAVSGLTGLGSARYLQITVPVQPGNSGGPLVTDTGLVVGVVAAKLRIERALRDTGTIPENVNFAVKSAELVPMLRGLALPRAPRIKSRTDAIARAQTAVCQVIATTAGPPAPAPTAPLSRAQIAETVAAMAPRLAQCKTSHGAPSEPIRLSIHIAPTGTVSRIDLAPRHERDPLARCVANVFRATPFPTATADSTFRYTYKGD